ncbi:phosphoribosyltransferase domain-containing protein [uncultured Clostridium sp.]|uniref:phosphoribosyltransferase domain-containing protein n=1 Tax=uncultured Clostridium sp. TaxID=59620 RepID=UPI002634CF38|nr:phosphoribosyltransferase domain-containing protein [uncultured Clostridium sp.]
MRLEIKENKFNLNIDDLISLGKRSNNEKRNFLFISKVLGKHLEIKPNECQKVGEMLANLIDDGEESLVLGFAETATGLGMTVASYLHNSYYVTTTREEITGYKSIFNFDEEHSHAVEHKCFLLNKEKIENAKRIVLVDDEITTGKSMLNLIKEIKKRTKAKEFKIVTILDWRIKEFVDMFKEFVHKEEVDIEVLSLIKGEIFNEDKTVYRDNDGEELKEVEKVIDLDILPRIDVETKYGIESYIKDTGRFGVSYEEIKKLEEKCKTIAEEINKDIEINDKVLILGHGENIYIPCRIASYLKGDVLYKSTTRSPIFCEDKDDYTIKSKNVFYHKGVKYYFYNKKRIEENYDKVFLIVEDDLNIKMTNNMKIVRI